MFDVIGDCHSCFVELNQLFEKMNYTREGLSFKPPNGRIAVFVGDLVSRGPHHLATIFLVKDMMEKGYALSVMGNHDWKILRWARGNPVSLTHGDDGTAREIENSTTITKEEVVEFFSSLPLFLKLDDGKLVVAHAAYKPLQGAGNNFDVKYRTWSLYGPLKSNKPLPGGLPDRLDWAAQRIIDEDSPTIVCGHQPFDDVRIINKVFQIDTGCCFGGKLSCVRWPEQEIIQVGANRIYCEK